MTRTIGVALLGLGNVGGGVVKLLADNAAAIAARLGATFEVRAIAVREVDKAKRSENGIITDVLQNKTNVDSAAAAALKRNPDLVKGWLDGVTTTTGGNGWQAVQTALGSK